MPLEAALKTGPEVYVASVARFVQGIDTAIERLSSIARDCAMPVLMANCVRFADGNQCARKISLWNKQGTLIGQLNDADEGMLIFDTEWQTLMKRVA